MSRFDYDVVTVETVKGPDGTAGKNWHRYVIANQITSITGYRSGTRKEVADHARDCATRLNGKLRNPFQHSYDSAP